MSRFATLALATEEARRMPILHPATGAVMVDRAGNAAYLELYSLSSEPAQKARAAIQQKRIDAGMRRISIEEADREAMTVLGSCTKGWHLVGLDGEAIPVPCDPSAALELYTTPGLRFIADQAARFADTAGNYLPASSVT